MNSQRFASLADAFGGDLDRWPAAERDQAKTFRDAAPDLAAEILAPAGTLDDLLSASAEPMFGGVMREQILRAAAPSSIQRQGRSTGRWLSGLALAAACAAGVIFGSSISDRLIGDPALEALDQASTSFDAVYSFDTEESG